MESKDLQRPKVGLGVYVLNDKRELLLLKRKGAHGEGSWCPPGGHLEGRETFEQCAKREAREELDISLQDIELIGVTNDISKDKHYVTVEMKAKIKSGQPRIAEPDKCSEFGWFELDKLPSPLFLPERNHLQQTYP